MASNGLSTASVRSGFRLAATLDLPIILSNDDMTARRYCADSNDNWRPTLQLVGSNGSFGYISIVAASACAPRN